MQDENQSNQIRIWAYSDAPRNLKSIVDRSFDWLALVPAHLAMPSVELLFTRWHTAERPVVHHTLPDGSVVIAGRNPPTAFVLEETPAEPDVTGVHSPRHI